MKQRDLSSSSAPALLTQTYHRGLHTFSLARSSSQSWKSLIPALAGEDLTELLEVEKQVAQSVDHWDELSLEERQQHILARRKKRVQSRDALSLYQAFLQNQDDSLTAEVLPYLSSEQFRRIVDLDVWQQDKIEMPRVMHWLGLCSQKGTAEVIARYRCLEEEYQIAILQPWVRGISPQQYEDLPPHMQERLMSFPGNAYYYDILCDDPPLREALIALMELFQQEDMEYALALLAYLTWCPPAEAEAQAYRFSQARNEEDGFIPTEEAWKNLAPLDAAAVRRLEGRVRLLTPRDSKISDTHLLDLTADVGEPFLARVLRLAMEDDEWMVRWGQNLIARDWIYSANHLAAALQLEPREHQEREELLGHVMSSLGLALDVLSMGKCSVAQRILEELSTQELLRYSYYLIDELRRPVVDHLIQLGLVGREFEACLRHHRYAQVLHLLDQNLTEVFGLEDGERIKGLFNRFPLAWAAEGGVTSERWFHRPVDSARVFWDLSVDMQSLLWFSRQAYGVTDGTVRSWESVWWNLLAHVALEGRVGFCTFDGALIKELLHCDAALRQQRLDAFCTALPGLEDVMGCQGSSLGDVLRLAERGDMKRAVAHSALQRVSPLRQHLEDLWQKDKEQAFAALKHTLTADESLPSLCAVPSPASLVDSQPTAAMASQRATYNVGVDGERQVKR